MAQRTYSQEELLKAVEFACGYQKACSYQEIANLLLEDGYAPSPQDIKALDNLADCDHNCHEELTIEDLHECIDETGIFDKNFVWDDEDDEDDQLNPYDDVPGQ